MDKMNAPRIALCGPLGGGKSTVAHHMAGCWENRNPAVLSFAAALKEVAYGEAVVYGPDREPSRADYQELSEYRHTGCWINLLHLQLQHVDPTRPVLIDDLRFPEEADYLRDQGFFIARLWVVPDVLRDRRAARDGNQPSTFILNHESEQHWPDLDADAEIMADAPVEIVAAKVAWEWGKWRMLRTVKAVLSS